MRAATEKEVARVVACAHDGCPVPAFCNIKLKTGRTNLCRHHYDQHFQIEADRANTAKGLNTVEEMRA